MKKFLIDTYRIFLLQTSKVIWDIVGLTLVVWIFFYFNATATYSAISIIGNTVGFWIVVRLYWQKGRKRIEEVETLRPASSMSKEISNLFVLLLFFSLTYGITGFLYYNFRFAKFILWLNNIFNLNLSNFIYNEYLQNIKYLAKSDLANQLQEISSAMCIFWLYVIPVAVAIRLKLSFRILFIILIVFAVLLLRSDLYDLFTNTANYTQQIIFNSFYILMFIYLIIPKRINFK